METSLKACLSSQTPAVHGLSFFPEDAVKGLPRPYGAGSAFALAFPAATRLALRLALCSALKFSGNGHKGVWARLQTRQVFNLFSGGSDAAGADLGGVSFFFFSRSCLVVHATWSVIASEKNKN